MKLGYIVIKKDLGLHKKGDQVRIEISDSGVPLDPYWRRRLKDASMDGCCELVKKKKSSSKKTKTPNLNSNEE